MEENKYFTKVKSNGGITLIALIITIIILIIIAGISIAALTSDNGVLRQTNAAKVEQIEGTAREQVKLAISAMRIAIGEAKTLDSSYSATKNSAAIQVKLIEILQADKQGLTGDFTNTGMVAPNNNTTISIRYTGEDYQNACNDENASIVYTISLTQSGIELLGETVVGGSVDFIDISEKLSFEDLVNNGLIHIDDERSNNFQL